MHENSQLFIYVTNVHIYIQRAEKERENGKRKEIEGGKGRQN
jgi:hypothetical protein